MLEFLFNKAVGLQECCKTYLLHTNLRFYFSLGKALKNVHQLSLKYVLKNIKFKVMFTEAYLDPSRTCTMELFCENS